MEVAPFVMLWLTHSTEHSKSESSPSITSAHPQAHSQHNTKHNYPSIHLSWREEVVRSPSQERRGCSYSLYDLSYFLPRDPSLLRRIIWASASCHSHPADFKGPLEVGRRSAPNGRANRLPGCFRGNHPRHWSCGGLAVTIFGHN